MSLLISGLSKSLLVVLVAVIVVAAVGGIVYYIFTSPTLPEEKVIKIGLIAPLTGPLSYGGNDMRQGAILAVEEINAKGGIKIGNTYYKIDLIIEDDEGNPTKATQVVQKLITQDKVFAIVGSYSSSVTLAVQPMIMESKKLLVVPVAVATKITDAGYKYTFRVCANQRMQTTQNAEFVYNLLHPRTFALLLENTDYGREGGQIWASVLESKGAVKVAEEYFLPGTTDFYSQLSKIKAANPDVVFVVASTNDAANILKQAKEIGLKKQFVMLGGVAQDEFLMLAGEAALGLVHVSYFEPTSPRPKAQEFVKAFKERWGRPPAMYAAGTYDAIYALKYAIEKAGTLDVDAVATAMRALDFEGVQGRIYFDEKGQAQTKVLLVQVQRCADGVNGLCRLILYPPEDKQTDYIPLEKIS
ncbi:ABC transporter substrate-binding protein [Thermofilum sp.]|uniref:ABC transporter substrate-binding protein n=1 Tax=Thermofilum sp. TaxID=1961369 RepID=UPI0031631718